MSRAHEWWQHGVIYKTNVETASANSQSILTFYRRLIELRRRKPALSIADVAQFPNSVTFCRIARRMVKVSAT